MIVNVRLPACCIPRLSKIASDASGCSLLGPVLGTRSDYLLARSLVTCRLGLSGAGLGIDYGTIAYEFVDANPSEHKLLNVALKETSYFPLLDQFLLIKAFLTTRPKY
jgi:hypothetical protein